MKTTFDLPDQLVAEAKRVAARRSTTVRALVEAGLRRELRESRSAPGFRLRQASFEGRGLRPEAAALGWQGVREIAYSGRGGGGG